VTAPGYLTHLQIERYLVVALISLTMSVGGFWTAFELRRRKPWARITIQIVAVSWIVEGLPAALSIDSLTHSNGGAVAFCFASAIVGAGWLVFFNLPQTRRVFASVG
jgi:hypothetical protein